MSEKQKSQEVIPKEITELLEHRATLGKWLAKLEELSGTVRPEVYDRVRGDYEQRLRSQETELTAHRSEMETALEEHRTRVTVLETDRDDRAAELEEAQLRFARLELDRFRDLAGRNLTSASSASSLKISG